MNRIVPMGKRLLVKVLQEVEETKGGIYVPDTAKDAPTRAEVMYLGMDLDDVPSHIIKTGDICIISKYGGTAVNHSGENYLIIQLEDILAKEIDD